MRDPKNVKHEFVIIDDDDISNNICNLFIGNTFPMASVRSFTDPQEGLNYLLLRKPETDKTTLLLDINMPIMNGWEVLRLLNAGIEHADKTLNVYILSSSVNFEDKYKAEQSPLVIGFIEKPLSQHIIAQLINS